MQSLLLAAVVAAAGWRWRWLTADGALAAALAGAAVLEFGGVRWAAALVVFFASGSLLTLAGRARKTQPEHRGRGRTAAQVLGTGGVAALVSVLWGTVTWDALRPLLPPAFFGALAAAAADTWATELGLLSPTPPRLLTSGRPVPPGTSGGVTLPGTAAGAAASALMAAVGVWATGGGWRLFWFICAAGVAAMFIDSLLGATVQAVFRRDGILTEEPGPDTVRIRGVGWITNSVVNLFATAAGALATAALALLWS
ncbi:MAG: DUF92 domain-containing protein [Armatimonadota bacterium]|nr:DUF92 domain-containing protein [Armatimonadota bacterium]